MHVSVDPPARTHAFVTGIFQWCLARRTWPRPTTVRLPGCASGRFQHFWAPSNGSEYLGAVAGHRNGHWGNRRRRRRQWLRRRGRGLRADNDQLRSTTPQPLRCQLRGWPPTLPAVFMGVWLFILTGTVLSFTRTSKRRFGIGWGVYMGIWVHSGLPGCCSPASLSGANSGSQASWPPS